MSSSIASHLAAMEMGPFFKEQINLFLKTMENQTFWFYAALFACVVNVIVSLKCYFYLLKPTNEKKKVAVTAAEAQRSQQTPSPKVPQAIDANSGDKTKMGDVEKIASDLQNYALRVYNICPAHLCENCKKIIEGDDYARPDGQAKTQMVEKGTYILSTDGLKLVKKFKLPFYVEYPQPQS